MIDYDKKDIDKEKDYFIQYNYPPEFDIYGLGLAHLIGSNAITLTRLLSQKDLKLNECEKLAKQLEERE